MVGEIEGNDVFYYDSFAWACWLGNGKTCLLAK
jgi:hypothetical protein